jgi:hypothetical protein
VLPKINEKKKTLPWTMIFEKDLFSIGDILAPKFLFYINSIPSYTKKLKLVGMEYGRYHYLTL